MPQSNFSSDRTSWYIFPYTLVKPLFKMFHELLTAFIVNLITVCSVLIHDLVFLEATSIHIPL
jgi:hypothetical protein